MKTFGRSAAALALLAFLLAASGTAQQASKDAPVVPPLTSVPTFSTENIARQGHFYVGGKWAGEPGKEVMRGAMYVETWVPKKIRYKYPILFVQSGGGETNLALLQTPDFPFNPQNLLHVMPDLMRDHIRLRELSRRSKPLLQFPEKTKVQIDFFITRAIERANRGLRHPAR